MRILLFIPVFILFLSNVPFIERVPLEQAISMMEENGRCAGKNECSPNENVEMTCAQEQSGCDEGNIEEPVLQCDPEKECSQKTETSCVCISCFQFAGSLQATTDFQFHYFSSSNKVGAFIPAHTKDQHIGAPWQPPDEV